MDRQAKPVGSQTRKPIAATLALIGCRVVSQLNGLIAGFAGVVIIWVLAVSIIAGMPRIRRLLLILASLTAAPAKPFPHIYDGPTTMHGRRLRTPLATLRPNLASPDQGATNGLRVSDLAHRGERFGTIDRLQ